MTSSDERRRYVRTSVLLRVEYASTHDLLADYLLDLSEGGLFIRTEVPFESDTELACEISFPGLLAPVELRGTVRWRKPAPDPGVGVELDSTSPGAGADLALVLAALRSARDASTVEQPRTHRVFVLEDNSLMAQQFRRAGHEFQRATPGCAVDLMIASDGGEAAALLESNRFELAVVDQFVPVMTGSELIRRIKADSRHDGMPVVGMSGDDDARRDLLDAGADLFLRKPLQLQRLLSTFDRLLAVRASVPPTTARSPLN